VSHITFTVFMRMRRQLGAQEEEASRVTAAARAEWTAALPQRQPQVLAKVQGLEAQLKALRRQLKQCKEAAVSPPQVALTLAAGTASSSSAAAGEKHRLRRAVRDVKATLEVARLKLHPSMRELGSMPSVQALFNPQAMFQ
jgi:hypothetical protein